MGRFDHHKTRRLIKRLHQEMGIKMSENSDRIAAALDGISGDISGLKAAYDALAVTYADLLDQAGVTLTAAVEEAKAEFEAALLPLAERAESLDAETPEVPVEEVPVEVPVEEVPAEPVVEEPALPPFPDAPVEDVPVDEAPAA